MSARNFDELLAPSRQPHTGPMFGTRPESWLANTGQVNPDVQRRLAAQQGRYLGGLGDSTMPEEHMGAGTEVFALEEQDDVYGSGIFDPHRRPAVANAETGVFESYPSLPGYLARQQPFTFSSEVASLPSGAAYAEVPAGGMAYVEAHGRPVWPQQTGPIPKPPKLATRRPPTGRLMPYSYLEDDPHGREVATPLAGVRPDTGPSQVPVGLAPPSPYYRPRSRGHARRKPAYRTAQLPTRPPTRRLAQAPAYRPMVQRAYGQEEPQNGDQPPAENGTASPDYGPLLRYAAIGLGLGAVGFMVFGTKKKGL